MHVGMLLCVCVAVCTRAQCMHGVLAAVRIICMHCMHVLCLPASVQGFDAS